MTDIQPRKRLYSHVTRSRFLHLEDALNIGKVRLFAGEYRKGNGASATTYHFLDLDDARVLFADLSWGKQVEFTDYKGTDNGDGPQSRVLKAKANGDKIWLEIQNGPGEIVGQGAVKPKGKPTAAVSVPLSVWEARKLAHAALAYIRAWETAHLLDVAPTGPVDGDSPAPVPARSPAAPVTTSSPVVTADATHPTAAHQVSAPVTTAPSNDTSKQVQNAATPPPLCSSTPTPTEIEPTVTGFWTYYNTTAKPAGIAYTHALNVVKKYGKDWSTAIAKLQEAMAKA